MEARKIKEIINNTKIIAIIRDSPKELLILTVEALVKGGIRVVEITLNRSDAIAGIEGLVKEFGDHIAIGAGTVLSIGQVEAVAAVGGKYIVSPNMDADVIRRTKALELISIPGAITPTGIISAIKAGADYVKLFPAASFGVGYLKALLSPLPDVPFLVVGGIGLGNVKEYLDAGARAAVS